MKTSIVYVTIKCVVQHPDNEEAEDVVNESDYSITPSGDDCKVLDTEMVEVEDRGECHPTEHYLL